MRTKEVISSPALSKYQTGYRLFRGCCSILIGFFFIVSSLELSAHIGVQNVFLESKAGPFPIRVTIRPPQVVPGLAEIFIRVHQGEVDQITALPVRYDTGRQGAPPPDIAVPVQGSPNLYRTELWFMKSGAHSVIIHVSGQEGEGEVMVPFDAIATRTLPMSKTLTTILAMMGILLIALASSIAGAAVRFAVLPPKTHPSQKRLWGARLITALQFLLVLSMIFYGKNWWNAEELEYQNNQLYQPMTVETTLNESDPRELTLTITDKRFKRGAALLPDHGKLMHLFLIGQGGESFAHLHPARSAWEVFKTELPELPTGTYRVFADITHETGFSHTLTNQISIGSIKEATDSTKTFRDEDDSWLIAPNPEREASFQNAPIQRLGGNEFVVNEEIELQFAIRDSTGNPIMLEPYMGMKSHLVVFKKDGKVFSHLHPSGSISMASIQAFETRLQGDRPPEVARAQIDPFCEIPSVEASTTRWWEQEHKQAEADLSFPYAFPQVGEYKIWVQVKIHREVVTRSFDIAVTPSR
jgi:hypothetical protein